MVKPKLKRLTVTSTSQFNDVVTIGSLPNSWSLPVEKGAVDGGFLRINTTTGAAAWTAVTKDLVGLGNVDNTADLDKPISDLTQAALDLKANLDGAALTNVDINSGTIDGTVIGGSVPADGSFTHVFVKDADGNNNFVIGASATEGCGWAKLYTDANNEIVILGNTGAATKYGAVSVTDDQPGAYALGLPTRGAGMFYNESVNSWLVGTGKYDMSIGAIAMSDAVNHASFTIYNGGSAVFNADETGKISAATATFTGDISANNLSGTNTGDETTATIKTKLGAATSLADGYLTAADWATFNGKQDALGYTAENVANKVTSITALSTNTEYPSAAAVWALAGSISADNGIIEDVTNHFQLGGDLLQATTINLGNFDLNLTTAGTGKTVISNVDVNGGTIDGTVIGGTVAADGTFTNLTVKDDAGNVNFVIGASSVNQAGYAELLADGSDNALITLGNTGTTTKYGSVSVSDNQTHAVKQGAGMFYNEAENNWVVGAGVYDMSIAALVSSDAVNHASFTIFNGTSPVFNANEAGNVTASGTIKGSVLSTTPGDFVVGSNLGTAYVNIKDGSQAVVEMGRAAGAGTNYGIKINDRTTGEGRASIGATQTGTWGVQVGDLATEKGVILSYATGAAHEARIIVADGDLTAPTFLVDADGEVNATSAIFTGAISASNLSNTNTGDETTATIKDKIGCSHYIS